MRPAEVLAIEVEHFAAANGMRILVPRLVGATARAQNAKFVGSPSEPISEDEWLASLREQHDDEKVKGAERAITWFREEGFHVEPTKSQDAMVARITSADGKPAYPFYIRRSSGQLETALANLITVPAFKSDISRKEIIDQIRSLPTSRLKVTDKLNGLPAIALEEIVKDNVWDAFRSLASKIKSAIESGSEVLGKLP
jgi:hypothetical protein